MKLLNDLEPLLLCSPIICGVQHLFSVSPGFCKMVGCHLSQSLLLKSGNRLTTSPNLTLTIEQDMRHKVVH